MEIFRPFENQLPTKYREQNDNFVPYVFLEKLFNESEVATIRSLWQENEAREGKIGKGDLNQTIRKSRVQFINDAESDWVYNKLAMACMMINGSRYQFDILGFQGALQLTEYGVGEFYGWHMDIGAGKSSSRKLSITVQLSDSSEYEGGDLQFLHGGQYINAPKTIGTAIIFPSFVAHQVHPVTAGYRRSIVGWIGGPAFH